MCPWLGSRTARVTVSVVLGDPGLWLGAVKSVELVEWMLYLVRLRAGCWAGRRCGGKDHGFIGHHDRSDLRLDVPFAREYGTL